MYWCKEVLYILVSDNCGVQYLYNVHLTKISIAYSVPVSGSAVLVFQVLFYETVLLRAVLTRTLH